MKRVLTFLLLTLVSSYTFAAEVLDENELISFGERVKYWPVLDVRDLVERSQRPIAGAQQIDDELEFDAGDIILIIGDDEKSAMQSALAIEKQFPGNTTIVVKEGYKTLRVIHGKKIKNISNSYFPGTFTIPSDTCETAPPVHMFDDSEE
ncbi:MAG: hypothetical protein OEL79_07300 [Chromatiales bacterium]|nr:hypothetical protein [Chromatiales bacterium]